MAGPLVGSGGVSVYTDEARRTMNHRIVPFTVMALSMTSLMDGQESVCDLFKDLKAADGRQLIVTGELIISKDLAALGAADCDHEFASPMEGSGVRVFWRWPTAIRLRASSEVPAQQIKQFQEVKAEADRLRGAGKQVSSSGPFSGRLRVGEADGFPAEITFVSFENLRVEALPDPGTLRVIPICELFQNLAEWKGKRIAVRGEVSGTFEGSWISGRCKGAFYTNGYRWPVSLVVGGPAYYSSKTAAFSQVKMPPDPPKGEELLRGRHNVTKSATYVGRLRMHDKYIAVCQNGGSYLTNGFGHLNAAAAELMVEAVRDVELTPGKSADGDEADDKQRCQPPNLAALCVGAATLHAAVSLGCFDRTRELLSKDGIDSKDSSESSSLIVAIRTGNDALVKLLIESGAPINPAQGNGSSPFWEAASAGKIGILKMLLKAGANVDGLDHQGSTYLASYGFFDSHVTKILLEAGANPNARESDGQTALMNASRYGYEDAVKLLIEHGADVNLKDDNGRSALMHAAAGKYVDAIPHLLKHGADAHARDRNGDTALDIARTSKNLVAVELLTAALL